MYQSLPNGRDNDRQKEHTVDWMLSQGVLNSALMVSWSRARGRLASARSVVCLHNMTTGTTWLNGFIDTCIMLEQLTDNICCCCCVRELSVPCTNRGKLGFTPKYISLYKQGCVLEHGTVICYCALYQYNATFIFT